MLYNLNFYDAICYEDPAFKSLFFLLDSFYKKVTSPTVYNIQFIRYFFTQFTNELSTHFFIFSIK